jgi:hypothetical protein
MFDLGLLFFYAAGCVASIGGLDHSLAKTVSKAAVASLQEIGGAEDATELLLSAWEADPRSKRLALPFLKTADLLFTSFDLQKDLSDRDASFGRVRRRNGRISPPRRLPSIMIFPLFSAQLSSASGSRPSSAKP